MSAKRGFGAGAFGSWVSALRSSNARLAILEACHRTGVFEVLGASSGMTSREIAQRANVDAHLLDGALNYLAFSDKVLEKEGDRFRLTAVGAAWLSSKYFAGAMDAYRAYACLSRELLPALRGEKRYGVDFIRDGETLARASHLFSSDTHPFIVAEMSRLGIRWVADLGCGAAQVLISLCGMDERLRGVGVDIDPGCLREAAARVAEVGYSDKISLHEGDILKPETFAANIVDRPVAFTAVAVVHEFLRDGPDKVVDLLHRYRELFAGSYFFLGEFDRVTDEEFRQEPELDGGVSLYYQHFIHPLSLQGLPMHREEWLDVFARANVEVVKVSERLGPRILVYVLRL
jgi:hypothetical protein